MFCMLRGVMLNGTEIYPVEKKDKFKLNRVNVRNTEINAQTLEA